MLRYVAPAVAVVTLLLAVTGMATAQPFITGGAVGSAAALLAHAWTVLRLFGYHTYALATHGAACAALSVVLACGTDAIQVLCAAAVIAASLLLSAADGGRITATDVKRAHRAVGGPFMYGAVVTIVYGATTAVYVSVHGADAVRGAAAAVLTVGLLGGMLLFGVCRRYTPPAAHLLVQF